MKISKVTALSIGGIAIVGAMGGIISYVSAAPTTLTSDLREAVEHIENLYMVENGNDNYTKISAGKTADEADTVNSISIVGQTSSNQDRDTNFIIHNNENGYNENIIENSTRSSILGGTRNEISRGTDSVIIAGSDNKMFLDANSSADVIVGGNYNEIGSTSYSTSYSTILGGHANKIGLSAGSEYSTILGGTGNKVNGSYSVAVGSGNQVYGNYSVVMGSNAIIANGNNSFFRSDGTNRNDDGSTIPLNEDDVFAIYSRNGLVVNSGIAAEGAQLTVGGPLIIKSNHEDNQIKCENGQGVGSIKLVESDGKSCLCSCNGTSWNSLYGQGVCEGVCNTTLHPECSDDPVTKEEINGKYYYTAKCKVGNRVAGSMFMDKNKTIHWACQTSDGEIVQCSKSAG